VQEFRVESSGYPAEFGTGTGGQVSVITKSGGNQFRGSAFEYFRSQKLDAQNHFDSPRNPDDSLITKLPKSLLKQNPFGGSMGGPVMKDRAFFFGSYEGYRLNAGKNFVEAVPSEAAWNRAVPAVAGLRPGFTAPGAIILPGASANADFDIAQLQATQDVTENSYGGRLDFKMNDKWSAYARVFRDQAESTDPQGVTGRFFRITLKPTNAIFNLQGLLGTNTINEFKLGYNGAANTESGPTQAGFENISISLSGSVANNGIAGQTGNSGIASPGGLVRVNSAGNGRGAPYNPYSVTFADSVTRVQGSHLLKFGADVRMIRMTTDQLALVRGGVGIFVGPGQTEDQIQPIEAERISTTLSSGPLLAYPIDPAAIRANFTQTRTTGRISRARRPDLGPGSEPLHQGWGVGVFESGGILDAEARHERQPRAEPHSRTEFPADRPGRVEAGGGRAGTQWRSASRGLQRVQHDQLRGHRRDAAQCAADDQHDRNEQGRAGPTPHDRCRGYLRKGDLHRRYDCGDWNEPSDPACIPL
jgi:hypothetical protein